MAREPEVDPRLPAALLDPAAYPHPVQGTIRLIETHISWVFIAPPFAYKVKRPVAFDFLDFRTLADRRHFCEEELRLNRRFAPDLYLDVVSVTTEDGRVRMGGAGRVIDHAVRMVAFSAADELKVLLEAGAVAAGEIATLAADLAAFQAQAENRSVGPLGDPQTLNAAALANFASLRVCFATGEHVKTLDELQTWTRAAVSALAPLRRERRGAGLVRDGHGDLHAGNIVRWRGRLVPFDCIEFNPGLRCLDVVSDVAFVVMDLQSRGHDGLAQVFLNAWLAATGDFTALRLLPFHVVYLSLVRAKVDALQLREATGASASRLRGRIDHYLQLARRRAWPGRRWLILMHGMSGSGKSWLTEQLAPLLPAIQLRADVERKRLAGVAAGARTGSSLGAGIYTREFSDRTYVHLLDCTAAALVGGQHVIVDATFLEAHRRAPFSELAARLQAALVIVHCEVSPELCRARVSERAASGRDPSEAGVEVLAAQLANAMPLSGHESSFTVDVTDTSPDPAAVARRIAEIGK